MWRRITEYPFYEVSDTGDVRRVGGKDPSGRILKLRPSTKGYMRVRLSTGNGRKGMRDVFVHRLVAMAFIGAPPPGKPIINHLDGSKSNNVPANLEWTDHHGNKQHAYDAGLAPLPPARRGAANHLAKLTWADAAAIREAAAAGIPQRTIAHQFSVHRWTVGRIILGRTWSCAR